MNIAISILLTLAGLSEAEPRAGSFIEQATIGTVGGVVVGFVAGEIAWIAAPKFPEAQDPYRTSLPAALISAYGVGVPLGTALGVHLSGLVVGNPSAFWPKWVGAEAAVLLASGASYLILDNTGEVVPSVIAYTLPIISGVGGAFAGSFVAQKLGWTAAAPSPFYIGLGPTHEGLALSCGIKLSF